MKTTLFLNCLVLALALINAESSQRQLRIQDAIAETGESPLDAFKAAIEKLKNQPKSGARHLRSEEDGKKTIKKFVEIVEKFKHNGHNARRMEDEDTDYHVDSLLGLVNGRHGFPPTEG